MNWAKFHYVIGLLYMILVPVQQEFQLILTIIIISVSLFVESGKLYKK